MNSYTPYLQAVRDRLPLLLFISAVAALAAMGYARHITPEHRVHFSYVVSLSQREEADEFRFDGYYALQATELFSRTLAGLLQTPELIARAHELGDVPLKTDNPRQLVSRVEVRQTAPQLVELTVRHESREAALQLVEGMKLAAAEAVERYHDEGIPAIAFQIVPTNPWSGVSRVSVPVITIATFVLVLFLGINTILLLKSINST